MGVLLTKPPTANTTVNGIEKPEGFDIRLAGEVRDASPSLPYPFQPVDQSRYIEPDTTDGMYYNQRYLFPMSLIGSINRGAFSYSGGVVTRGTFNYQALQSDELKLTSGQPFGWPAPTNVIVSGMNTMNRLVYRVPILDPVTKKPMIGGAGKPVYIANIEDWNTSLLLLANNIKILHPTRSDSDCICFAAIAHYRQDADQKNPLWYALRKGSTYSTFWELIDLAKSWGITDIKGIIEQVAKWANETSTEIATHRQDMIHFYNNMTIWIGIVIIVATAVGAIIAGSAAAAGGAAAAGSGAAAGGGGAATGVTAGGAGAAAGSGAAAGTVTAGVPTVGVVAGGTKVAVGAGAAAGTAAGTTGTVTTVGGVLAGVGGVVWDAIKNAGSSAADEALKQAGQQLADSIAGNNTNTGGTTTTNTNTKQETAQEASPFLLPLLILGGLGVGVLLLL